MSIEKCKRCKHKCKDKSFDERLECTDHKIKVRQNTFNTPVKRSRTIPLGYFDARNFCMHSY